METVNTIRIKNKNEYIIQVNEQGDTISFNLEDPELMLKLDKTYQDIRRIQQTAKAQELVIRKKQDQKTEGMLSQNEKSLAKLAVKMFQNMRKVMDNFLGENACQKIFGNRNYITMYDDLFEQLEPHFAKMKLNAELFKKQIQQKYTQDQDDILR